MFYKIFSKIKKETPAQVFSCVFRNILKLETSFVGNLQVNALQEYTKSIDNVSTKSTHLLGHRSSRLDVFYKKLF